MANIVKINSDLIKERDKKKIDLLKPLINQIKLFDSFVGRVYKLNDINPLKDVKKGDKISFKRRESSYSKNEVLIYSKNNKLIGFIPEIDEIVVSRLMDAGKKLFGKVTKISFVKKYPVIAIEIIMEDF